MASFPPGRWICGAIALTVAAEAPAGAAIARAPARSDNSVTAQFARMFISACMNGELNLSPAVARKATSKELQLGTPRNQVRADHYRIRKPARAALRVAYYDPPTRDGWAQTCMLHTRIHEIGTAWKLITAELEGVPVRHIKNTEIYAIDDPANGYHIWISGSQLMSAIYSDAAIAKARNEGRRMTVNAVDSIFIP